MDKTEFKKMILNLVHNDTEFKFELKRALEIDELEIEIENIHSRLN